MVLRCVIDFDVVFAAVAAGEQTELLVGLRNDGNKLWFSCVLKLSLYLYIKYLCIYIYNYVYICMVCNDAIFKMLLPLLWTFSVALVHPLLLEQGKKKTVLIYES